MAQTKRSKSMSTGVKVQTVKAEDVLEAKNPMVEDKPAVLFYTVEEEKEGKASVPVKPKKVFGDRDLIPCVSITAGELFFVGAKSKDLYTFANADYVCEIEYRDLKYAAMTRDKSMYKPRFIVQDKDFLAEFPDLAEVYGPLYSTKDLLEMLKLSPAQMKKAVEALPDGAKESLKVLVSGRIDSGQFDSIQRIKILDEIFGTEMLLKLTGK